jgi:4-amino-4-deoxy-L-arabinose transferase-like glycosyltransferase
MRDPYLWTALALALAFRLGLLLRYPYTSGMGDEPIHYLMALLTLQAGPGVLGQWAPLYDLLLAGIFGVAGPDPLAARGVQVAISTATVLLLYDLARANGSLRAARIAAFLCALDPTLAAFPHYLFGETLFLALLVASVWALFRRGGRRGRRDLLLAGALFGLTALTRSVVLYFLPVWGLWSWLRGRRPEARQAALVFAVALAVVLPWTLRNAFKYHGFLLVDGTLGRTAYFAFSEVFFTQDHGYNTLLLPRNRRFCRPGRAPGLGPLPSYRQARERIGPDRYGIFGRHDSAVALMRTLRFAEKDLVSSQRCELAAALAFTRAHPGTVAGHIVRRFYAFWGPNSFLLRAIARGIYPDGPLARRHYGAWRSFVVLWHMALVATAVLAFGRRGAPALLHWALLLTAYYTAIHMLAVAHSRYRLPVMPFVMLASAHWLAAPRLPERGARGAAATAALLFMLGLCAHYALFRLP